MADDAARQLLRDAGLRVTGTRVALILALQQRAEPASLDDAVRLCGHAGGDPATIYRNLQALTEAGVLHAVRGVGRREMFELPAARHEHAHVSCTRCGRVECVEVSRAPLTPKAPRGWKVDSVSLTVWGLCPECRSEDGDA
jgi:Fe2+ or Zn2+ uptake regulation protein